MCQAGQPCPFSQTSSVAAVIRALHAFSKPGVRLTGSSGLQGRACVRVATIFVFLGVRWWFPRVECRVPGHKHVVCRAAVSVWSAIVPLRRERSMQGHTLSGVLADLYDSGDDRHWIDWSLPQGAELVVSPGNGVGWGGVRSAIPPPTPFPGGGTSRSFGKSMGRAVARSVARGRSMARGKQQGRNLCLVAGRGPLSLLWVEVGDWRLVPLVYNPSHSLMCVKQDNRAHSRRRLA